MSINANLLWYENHTLVHKNDIVLLAFRLPALHYFYILTEVFIHRTVESAQLYNLRVQQYLNIP